jgi:hypothetical protein
MPQKQKSLFPELDKIISVLRSDARQDLVILLIPSHDKNEDPLPDQDRWAGAPMELFAELFRGATAFQAFAGIYKCDDGKILHDRPILIESYVARSDLEDERRLKELLHFAKRLGKETRQAAVALLINSVFHEITDYSGV